MSSTNKKEEKCIECGLSLEDVINGVNGKAGCPKNTHKFSNPQPTDTAHMDQKRMNLREGSQQGIQSTEKECTCMCHTKGWMEKEHGKKGWCAGICLELARPTESSWMEEEREAWDETSKCYDIAGSVRPIVTDYWLTRMAEQIKAETKRCLAAHSSQIPFIFQKGQKIGVEQGRTEERERVTSEIQLVKKRFLCGACNGAKCEHTLGCKALNELLDKLK